MARRERPLLVVAGVVLVVGALAVVQARADRPCPTVGFADTSPIVVRGAPPDDGAAPLDALDACLGARCDPAPVPRDDDGAWRVPQAPPFPPVEEITVRAAADGTVRVEGTLPVPRTDARSWWERAADGPGPSSCPGPFRYGAVVLDG